MPVFHLCDKLVVGFDAILVLGPEHARVLTEAGWDRDRIIFELHMRLTTPLSDLIRGAGGIDEGLSPGGRQAESPTGEDQAPPIDLSTQLPKFRPDGLMLAYTGGGGGLFSMIVPGWVNGETGSKPVTRPVQY